MAESPVFLDPWSADQLLGGRLDPSRALAISGLDPVAIARAVAALANMRGGDVLLGAAAEVDGTLTAAEGLPAASAEEALHTGLALVDPPVGHLVRTRTIAANGGVVLVARVRLSPSTPHIVTDSGLIPWLKGGEIRPVRTRRELDELYARGRGERERADRLIDAMAEKLALGHYAFYNLAIIACTHAPSAEPFRAAESGALAPAGDPFVEAFRLHEHEPKAWPGEIELRTEGETGGYLRVTRSGCVAAGEIQRRPYHEELDTAEGLRSRVEKAATTACRLLARAADGMTVPHVFIEGVRGLRLVTDATARIHVTTGSAPQDTARHALAIGDARDPDYPARLAVEALSRLESLFPPA